MNYDTKEMSDFNDPIIRCESCQELLLRATVSEIGCCSRCGNRRVKNVNILQPDEMEKLKKWKVDPEFIVLFEERENPQPFEVDPDTVVPGVTNG